MPSAEPEVTLANVAAMIRSASDGIAERDKRIRALENSVNDVLLKMGRPHGGGGDAFGSDAREQAIGLLELKHLSSVQKRDVLNPLPQFSSEQIREAETAVGALKALLHSTSIDQLSLDQRKSLSAFSFGSQGFLLAPEMSNQVLSCLTDETDIAGLMQNVSISSGSIKFLVDNEVWDIANWACEANCFANNPTQQLGSGLGELEIKAESLRYVLCVTRDLLDDSSVNIEQWAFGKVNRAFRATISNAILTGDGFGGPMGILNPAAGIPIVETGEHTPPGEFRWQDLVALRWQVPMMFGDEGAYLLNQNTWGLISTMSDAAGRPIMTVSATTVAPPPVTASPFLINGRPVIISTQMPDPMPGATPVAYGNWTQTYMVVNRKAVTMQHDPFSAGFCVLMKFESRVGGAVVCPNAARLLRIR